MGLYFMYKYNHVEWSIVYDGRLKRINIYDIKVGTKIDFIVLMENGGNAFGVLRM